MPKKNDSMHQLLLSAVDLAIVLRPMWCSHVVQRIGRSRLSRQDEVEVSISMVFSSAVGFAFHSLLQSFSFLSPTAVTVRCILS